MASTGAACPSAPAFEAGALTGMQFVSAAQGWVVGQHAIMATADGGAHWVTQLSGMLDLTSVDFVNGQDGWVAGTNSLLATTDGGAHWAPLPEPCPRISSVHFISPLAGYAVTAGGTVTGADGSTTPYQDGAVLATSDGGHTWHSLPAPHDAQTVCFSDADHGWLGAGGLLYRTSDGGLHWSGPLTPSAGATMGGYSADMIVQCAGDGAAWALRAGPGAGMSQQQHVAYHADQSGVTAIFAEQYYHVSGDPAASSPGAYAGPFSALSPSAAVFIDSCAPCGAGTAPWGLVTRSGATLTEEGNVGKINFPQAASFLSPDVGWVAGYASSYTSSTAKSQERIVATTDGGRTWHVRYAGPWTS